MQSGSAPVRWVPTHHPIDPTPHRKAYLKRASVPQKGSGMKSDSVWVSTVDMDNTLTQMMSVDRTDPVWAAVNEARMPSPDDLPIKTWADSPQETFARLPLLFSGGGGTSFTGEIAAPILNFDLGRTFVLPMRIFLHDRKTEVHADRNYYTMPRYEVFEALAPENSFGLRPSRYSNPPKVWSLTREIKDDDVAVHARALDGPAIWHDPQLISGQFFCGDVVAAMVAAGVARHWRLHRCRIVWPN